MTNVNELVAAIWAKCNADIAALKLKAQQDVNALYAEAKQQRLALAANKPRKLTKAEIRQQSKRAAYRAEVKANPIRYWSHRMYDNTLPPGFDWNNLPPVPEDGADDDVDFT